MDNGDGTCAAFRIEQQNASGPGIPIGLNCNSPAYAPNATCGAILSSVKIGIRRVSSGQYVQPDINKWLTNMGLAGVNLIAGILTVEVDHTPFPIPQFIAPAFFTSLVQVRSFLPFLR